MPKITNITPDEREQAIYTIGKLGEEVTDERIEYYVQLHRNTVKHQEEKEKEELLNNRNKREEIQKEWRSNTKKEKNEDVVRKAKLLKNLAFGVGVILILAPFFITGFGFGWFWYLLIIGVAILCLALMGTDGRDKGDFSFAKSILIGFCIVGCLMYLWGPLNPNYERSGGSWFSSSAPKPDLNELNEKIYRQTGWQPYQFTIEKLELSVEKPPIYEFELKGPYGVKATGQCSVYNDGSIKNVVMY